MLARAARSTTRSPAGTLRPRRLDPAFWDKGLSMISGFIDELEAMED
jgi:hypothetical protein